jgi:hypothetical protein
MSQWKSRSLISLNLKENSKYEFEDLSVLGRDEHFSHKSGFRRNRKARLE